MYILVLKHDRTPLSKDCPLKIWLKITLCIVNNNVFTLNNCLSSKTTQMAQKCVLSLETLWVLPPLPHSALVQIPASSFTSSQFLWNFCGVSKAVNAILIQLHIRWSDYFLFNTDDANVAIITIPACRIVMSTTDEWPLSRRDHNSLKLSNLARSHATPVVVRLSSVYKYWCSTNNQHLVILDNLHILCRRCPWEVACLVFILRCCYSLTKAIIFLWKLLYFNFFQDYLKNTKLRNNLFET